MIWIKFHNGDFWKSFQTIFFNRKMCPVYFFQTKRKKPQSKPIYVTSILQIKKAETPFGMARNAGSTTAGLLVRLVVGTGGDIFVDLLKFSQIHQSPKTWNV